MRRAAAAMLASSALLTAFDVGDGYRPTSRGAEAALSDLGEKLSATPTPIDTPRGCPAEMVEIVGDYCPAVEQFCAEYIDLKSIARDRCALFRPTGRCFGKPEPKHFCIDRYEWPNHAGVKPDIGMNWEEAKAKCDGAGKRLCEANEWTLACEGQERLPYPYGYARNTRACNIDRPYILPDLDKFADPTRRAAEFARLDQRDPSGTRESCVSPYGVFDTTGNVDEWVVDPSGKENEKPYKSALKGGYWGPVRNRCRPETTDHNRWHLGYAIGFRCCENAASSDDAPQRDAK
jgi:sulfatase modifying factor 1